VADNYVICNSPYSLAKRNSAENWGRQAARGGRQHGQGDAGAHRHPENFLPSSASAPLGELQTDEEIDRCMANLEHGFSAAKDREQYGIAGAARAARNHRMAG
jgi:hypothetical protein